MRLGEWLSQPSSWACRRAWGGHGMDLYPSTSSGWG